MNETAMFIQRMDHFTIVTDRLLDTVAFYSMLGLQQGPRPNFPVPGAWLYSGDRAVLHLVEVTNMPEPRRGALDHIAYWARGLLEVTQVLDARGITHRIIRAPAPFRMWQLFFEDPNGVEVELDFSLDEIAPEDWKTRGRSAERQSLP
jgi:catechol 2,3-dioxygenase-like lactoylglutathione lyase family enzyme